ncbi:MAG TPA: TrmH family RNA methyltransferase [Melioribacteraceae bacterium]|nr:TrmH family RNA methyltransferase [Melioribacteraceae bacterium]
MRKFKTEKRLQKIAAAASARQFSLSIVLENVHDPHNVSAILRTCEAVGIPKVNLLYTIEKFPKLSRVSSASATKWIETEKFDSIDKCFESVKKSGYKIYSSFLDPGAVSLYELDLTEKIAIVLGNENRGVSEETKKRSDGIFYIPMKGMIQSLNVSVATGVILFEALRQRELKGMYNQPELSNEELDELIDKWCCR